jgi:Tfp pilus assembly PilM family ATPase
MIFARNKGWIGIDLDASRMKIAQVERTGGGLRLAASAVLPRSLPDTTRPSVDNDGGPVGREAATAAQQNGGLTGRQVACVLPMVRTDVHTLQLPAAGDSERRALVEQEMIDRTGDFAKHVYDYWICPANHSEGGPAVDQVGVVSAPRALVDRLISDLAVDRFRCKVIDGLPPALARAVQMLDRPDPDEPVAAVQWGYDSGLFCIIRSGQPVFTRHLRNCGFARPVEAVASALNITRVEVYEIFAQSGLPDLRHPHQRSDLQEVLAELTSEAVVEFCEELKKTVSYLRSQNPETAPRRLYLMGDGAGLKNVEAHVQQRLGFPVAPWQMSSVEAESPQPHAKSPQLFAAAAALSALAFEK